MAADGIHAQLQAWREQGADRLDPLRFGFIEALAARAPRHRGAAGELLEQRLSGLVQAYADDLLQAPAGDCAADAPTPGPLSGLLAHMARPADAVDVHVCGTPAAAPAIGEQAAPAMAFEPLPVLDELRAVWSRMRNDSQLRESLEQVPEDAGPLNSDMLVHRALQLMQATAPGYLQHFIAYADTLSSLQQLRESRAGTTAAEAAPGAGVRKPARPRTRKRAG